MNRIMKNSNTISMILCSLSIAGLIFTNTFYILLRNVIINTGDVEGFIERFSIPVTAVYALFGFFHIAAIFTLVLELNFFKRDNFLRAFLFFLSIISLMMLFGDFALMSDISKEYIFGLPGEFNILFFSQFLHFIFYILMIILLIYSRRLARKKDREIVLKDDSIFINAQYIGILSGISGLFLITIFSTLYLNLYDLPVWAIKSGIIMSSILAVIPYVFIIFYWLIIKLREKISEWYDEKQFQDITRSSLVALLMSILILLIIFIIQYIPRDFEILNYIWFPLYFFFILFLFSSTTLFFYKRQSI